MYNFPIGIMMHSLREDDKTAIESARKMGVQGLQFLGTYDEHSAEQMTQEKRKELMKMMDANGLVFSAVCGDFGVGFWNPETNAEQIEKSKRVIDMALDLGTNIVTTHIGAIPDDPNEERYKIMQEACFELSRYADSMKSHFAIETGPEKAVILRDFLDTLGSRGVAVNLDPANFVMVTGDDPVQAVYTLKDYIVHTHAKDGIKLDPNATANSVYNVDSEEKIITNRSFIELPLGEGGVDFDNYLKALEEIGYRGFLTIEREVGEDPKKDIGTAVEFLRNKIEVL
ncbi:MAG: sugar phosphate isomerase/epimerase [Clostridia bacterium]|nr:sugar phosphate isomerase/epimerase [Clostridia bacterium]